MISNIYIGHGIHIYISSWLKYLTITKNDKLFPEITQTTISAAKKNSQQKWQIYEKGKL